MDLVALLRRQIAALPPGQHRPGLEATVAHVDCAFRHRQRAIEAADDTLFSDAIYRCNHAFEGGLKEAYRVLAGKDPNKVTPYEIEAYLEKGAIFRERVLKQLKIYRTEWRNPSTHDYTLDFDQSESLLAIVSVAAFTSMVLDEIAERLSFDQSKEEAEKSGSSHAVARTNQANLQHYLSKLIQEFCRAHIPENTDGIPPTERQLIGALHGYLASAAPDLRVEPEAQLAADKPFRPDLLVGLGSESIVIELKRRLHKTTYHNALAQVEHYMLIGGLKSGMLVFMPSGKSDLDERVVPVEGLDGSILVLSPREA